MGAPASPTGMTADDFLAWERAQPEKHEFHDGEVFAMAGGSPRHNVLSASVGAELRVGVVGLGGLGHMAVKLAVSMGTAFCPTWGPERARASRSFTRSPCATAPRVPAPLPRLARREEAHGAADRVARAHEVDVVARFEGGRGVRRLVQVAGASQRHDERARFGAEVERDR
jgi:D-arabinose 1-dehydrogenase-like Zn-dependent alcohol dehydrogenase